MRKKDNSPFNKKNVIPFFTPWITNEDKKEVLKALGATMLTDGPNLRQFELDFAKFTGAKYAIGVSNATTALHLSLLSLQIGKNDEVIVPDMTFVATANAVVHAGAKPVLADVDKQDMNISIDSIEENITSRTKAIIPVHFAGNSCKMDKIKKIAQKYNIYIIEDCAHAIGARYHGKHVGTFGDVGCFSFYPTKNITTIEGGMITTNSKQIADFVTKARNHGISKTLSERYSIGKPWDYDIINSGYNYRLDEIRSALGISQLKRIHKLNSLRKNACQYYNQKLKKVNGIITPDLSDRGDNVFHLYIIKVQKAYGISRDELFDRLTKCGISTTVHYKPLHMFTVFKNICKETRTNNTSALYDEIISLPLFPQITKQEQDAVIKCIKENQKIKRG